MKSLRIAVITGPTQKLARKQILYAEGKADALELRVDYFQNVDLPSLLEGIHLPTILTPASKAFFNYHFNYLDISSDHPPDFFALARNMVPKAQIITSFHNFKETPKDLEIILEKMLPTKANIFKIACLANSEKDADRMIAFAKEKNNQGCPLIGICMGEKGVKSRLSSLFDYRSIPFAKKSAPGQLML